MNFNSEDNDDDDDDIILLIMTEEKETSDFFLQDSIKSILELVKTIYPDVCDYYLNDLIFLTAKSIRDENNLCSYIIDHFKNDGYIKKSSLIRNDNDDKLKTDSIQPLSIANVGFHNQGAIPLPGAKSKINKIDEISKTNMSCSLDTESSDSWTSFSIENSLNNENNSSNIKTSLDTASLSSNISLDTPCSLNTVTSLNTPSSLISNIKTSLDITLLNSEVTLDTASTLSTACSINDEVYVDDCLNDKNDDVELHEEELNGNNCIDLSEILILNDKIPVSEIFENKTEGSFFESHDNKSIGGTRSSIILKMLNNNLKLLKEKNLDSVLNNVTSEKNCEEIFYTDLMYSLLEIFPNIDPRYLANMCQDAPNTKSKIEELSLKIIETSYPTIDTYEMCLNQLKDLFPDTDPEFLEINCKELYKNVEQFQKFIFEMTSTKNYPSKDDYLRKHHMLDQIKVYTNDFNCDSFLQMIPEPLEYFSEKTNSKANAELISYVKTIFKNIFNYLTVDFIYQTLEMYDYDLMLTYGLLLSEKNNLGSKRKFEELPRLETCDNFYLLQMATFLLHREQIMDQYEIRKKLKLGEHDDELYTCICCYEEDFSKDLIYFCQNGHAFCRTCVQRSVQMSLAESSMEFKCLTECNSSFSMKTLQEVCNPQTFTKIFTKKQLEEIKSADVTDLEFCPFCDYAQILPSNNKIFKCMNIDCLKQTCRYCKELSHIPYGCNEEKPTETKARTYIENQMSEALIRTCWKCQRKFIKMDGCNKMTCQCGAIMCYVCKKPVKDYSHFNGQGGTEYHKCPLFCDMEKLHLKEVFEKGKQAKDLIYNENPNLVLKLDPLATIPKQPGKNNVYNSDRNYEGFDEEE